MGSIVRTIHAGIQFIRTDWTPKRLILLLLLAVTSEYILTDLQTISLSPEGVMRMVESVNVSSTMLVQGTFWFEPDHVSDLVVALGFLIGTSGVLILAGRKKYIRNLFILFNIFVLFTTVYNVLLMVASMWSNEGVALMYLMDAALIWVFCIFSFGVFYWVIDAELQESLVKNPVVRTNFLFPQMANHLAGWEQWTPSLIDYLFLSFTCSTSFGPTDTQILSITGKSLMVVQATISLVLIVTIAARAISII